MWRINAAVPQLIAQHLLTQGATTHFVHISSASVYGFSHAFKTEKSPIVATDPYYTASKAAAHTWLRELMATEPEVPITVLAPVIVWGPGDRAYLPLLKARLRSQQMVYPGKSRPVDFVHIDDLVDAVLLCFDNEQAYNEEFIISGPSPFTFEAYVEGIAEVTQLPPPQVTLPDWVGMAAGFTMEQAAHLVNLIDPAYEPALTRLQVRLLSTPFRVSIHKAQTRLGYEPEIDFAKGMEDERLQAYMREL
jgi:nucleoside-diphosphate-sugar epimerase